MAEDIHEQINNHRATAQMLGDAAVEAMGRGDIGVARTSARLAAQWARVVLQLEDVERQIELDDEEGNGTGSLDLRFPELTNDQAL